MPKVNNFFDKVYIINLIDMKERWEKMEAQFKKFGIKAQRYLAIDGRCKLGLQACVDKAKTFEIAYNVKIFEKDKPSKKELKSIEKLLPAASLTIGTVCILRDMVRRKLKRILICEDDIVVSQDFHKRFSQGIHELEKTKYANKWDLLYLGCGHDCGNKGLSLDGKSKHAEHPSQLNQFTGANLYVQDKDDLRDWCSDCKEISKNLSIASNPGGTWCYAWSLKGAKKMLKLMDAGGRSGVSDHIDQIIARNVRGGELLAISWDSPICMHEYGAIRADSQIPWSYDD